MLLLYGLAHAYWAFGGDGFPFGADDADPEYSALEHVGRDRLAPWIAGGFLGSAVVAVGLMVASAIIYQRRTSGACTGCGRTDSGAGWTSPEAAARWGRRAAYTAVVVPLLYAGTRWAWALGIPLGISEELWEEGEKDNLWIVGAALAAMGALGSLLTLGLVRRWGEVFPRWMVGLRGRRVPLSLAVVPATLVSVLVTIAGVMYIRLHFQGAFYNRKDDWGATVPEMIWPVWGATLAAATLAYYFRRRGVCKRCARG